jgi:hypothetical protein
MALSGSHTMLEHCDHAARDTAAIWEKSSSDPTEAGLLEAVVDGNRQSFDWRVEKP